MTWPVQFDKRRISLFVKGRISENDAQRQEATAAAILERLARQPGLILADEVGMGKTFVALAVAASAAWADRGGSPVIVMVPPSLRDKWPRDFETFRELCLTNDRDRGGDGLRAKLANNGVEFFRLLDDPRSKRCHIIFLVYGALYRALGDPWVKFAILKQALQRSRLTAQRKALPQFAAEILQKVSKVRDPQLFRELLRKPYSRWREILTEYDLDPGDDPVPEAIERVLKRGRVDLRDLRACLRDLPLRRSLHVKARIKDVRQSLNQTIQGVWDDALVRAKMRSPLLILDEAHHLKNPATRLASLFVEPDPKEEARLLEGALLGSFERMLFLTATPFQLGHHELLNVLERFRAVRWRKRGTLMDREEFESTLSTLRQSLDKAYLATTHLDRSWARISRADIKVSDDAEGELREWWHSVTHDPTSQSEKVQGVWRAFVRAREAMRDAELALKQWVIRHVRPSTLPQSATQRRRVFHGAAIVGDDIKITRGLAVSDDALLPFLLAARSQAVVRHSSSYQVDRKAQRATFAEGLASSYEAFLETRSAGLGDGGGRSEELTDEDADAAELIGDGHDVGALPWYLERLHSALPSRASYGTHPKIAPTVTRARELWENGEKVLIFCHYRATGSSLTRHLSTELARTIRRIAAFKLGCQEEEAERRLELLGERFDTDRPLYGELKLLVDQLFEHHSALAPEEKRDIFEVARRFVRTPSFLARYFPLDEPDPNTAFRMAMKEEDSSGLSLPSKLEAFVDFLANRCVVAQRAEYLKALREIQTGTRRGGRDLSTGGGGAYKLLPSVRRATGADDHAERQRTLLGFNSPFFPEILVASSVLAEGVDLHLDCRHVIHHDLCWSPSTLEQRTGRVDRIAAKAERVGKSIQVYLPFVAETQDEKMYRVVLDRERWFQVLMGEEYVVDEGATDQVADRVPLPTEAAEELAFKLHVWKA